MMAKTYKNLFEHLTTFEALHRAYGRVVKGRRHQMDVIRFETNLESNLIEIQNSLLWKTYQTGPYRNFKVFEPKERDIAALPIKDRIARACARRDDRPDLGLALHLRHLCVSARQGHPCGC